MKIITNHDINSLLIFAKKNLGMYKLVYYKYRKTYWVMIALTVLSLILLLLYAMVSYKGDNHGEGYIFASCLLSLLMTLYISHRLNKLTHLSHLQVQTKRYKLLKQYYRKHKLKADDILVINDQLSKRLEKISKQRITVVVVLGMMSLPLWNVFVEYMLSKINMDRIAYAIFLTLCVTIAITIIVKILNQSMYLYEESFYVKNNVFIIENIIFLNKYIIKENNAHG